MISSLSNFYFYVDCWTLNNTCYMILWKMFCSPRYKNPQQFPDGFLSVRAEILTWELTMETRNHCQFQSQLQKLNRTATVRLFQTKKRIQFWLNNQVIIHWEVLYLMVPYWRHILWLHVLWQLHQIMMATLMCPKILRYLKLAIAWELKQSAFMLTHVQYDSLARCQQCLFEDKNPNQSLLRSWF